MKKYVSFNHKEANFRLSAPGEAVLISSIIQNRKLLDRYITKTPGFTGALAPIPAGSRGSEIPMIAGRMYRASDITGLGPMASVAGGFAQMAVEAAVEAGEIRAVVENGGDICLVSPEEIVLGIHPGEGKIKNRLAFLVPPTSEPLAICSSSSTMGHSLSFGKCDLAVVTGPDAFLADSAATLACNMIREKEDIQPVLEKISGIPGINGILVIFGELIGMAGDLPELVKNRDPEIGAKITRDINSGG